MREGHPVTIAELLASGIRPSAGEAAALVLAVCDQLGTGGKMVGVPPPVSGATVQLERSGLVTLAGGAPGEDDQTVPLLGRLLEEMLSGGDCPQSPDDSRRLCATARRASNGQLAGGVPRLKQELRPYLPASSHRDALAGLVHRFDGRRNPFFDATTAWVPPGTRQDWWRRRAAVVGTTLLLLVGAGAAYWLNDLPSNLLSPSASRSAATAAPREAPAWDLVKTDR